MGIARFSAVASALLALHVDSSVADLVTYDWRVTSLSNEYDGVFIHSLGINDKPADQAEVEVRVTNEIDEPTCLHWHGLKQLGTQEMDGTSEITQCHIAPNATAIYRFMPDKAGTFWWHSHHMAQYAFGLRGPLDWEKDIDGEYTIQMADLYHRHPLPTRMWDNILINNRGRHLSKFHFQAGNKYLLRLINMAALSPIVFSIDDHEFQVVAADGDHLQPSKLINSVTLNAGQRYDIVVEAKPPQTRTRLVLFGCVQTDFTAFRGREEPLRSLVRVTPLKASQSSPMKLGNEADPTSQKQQNLTTVSEFDSCLYSDCASEVASDRAVLQFKMQDGLGHFAIDGDRAASANANARKIELGKHIEVVLVNVKDEQHPFHMHTHSPWVVGSGVASIDQIRNKQLPPLKLLNPMTRDVYTVPPCTSDGKGGCLDAGYLAGLSMILVEGEEELQQKGVSAFSNTILSVCGSNSKFSPSNSTMHAL
ncbi:Multicopper oxidase, type 3 [Phytophthora cactorum]|nr:Multicopper oxidase, type 3 [Phytophthora cactorum]